MNKLTLAAVISLLAINNSHAEPSTAPVQVEAELGILLTSGNTESSALSGRLNVKQDLRNWRNDYILQGLYKKDETEQTVNGVLSEEQRVTAERYFLSAQTDYKLDEEHRGLFVFGSYEEDKFSGYDFQSSLAAGYSDRLFRTADAYLDYSVGPGYSFNRTDASIDSDGNVVAAQSNESAIVRLSALFEYDFSENAKFTQTLASDIALESDANTRSKSVSAVTANINQSFALKASLTLTHNSEVPELRENRDTTAAMSLVYSF